MRALTVDQIEARYQDGFGKGEGETYKSWFQAHDVPSRGKTTRFNGQLIDRPYVALSDTEYRTMLAVQRLDRVVDMREQFPLWPISETEEIAAELDVLHPRTPSTKLAALMTSDIVLTVRDGNERKLEAIACKSSADLSDKRTLEKLEIERIYWKKRGVTWSIVTNEDISPALRANLVWLQEAWTITPETVSPEDVAGAISHLGDLLARMSAQPLIRICQKCDDDCGLLVGSSILVFRHALSRKIWRAPLNERIYPDKPLPVQVAAALVGRTAEEVC